MTVYTLKNLYFCYFIAILLFFIVVILICLLETGPFCKCDIGTTCINKKYKSMTYKQHI